MFIGSYFVVSTKRFCYS